MNKDIQNENYDLNVSEFYELYLKEIVLCPVKYTVQI